MTEATAEAEYRTAHTALRALSDKIGELRAELARLNAAGSWPEGPDRRPQHEAALAEALARMPAAQARERHCNASLDHHRRVLANCESFAKGKM